MLESLQAEWNNRSSDTEERGTAAKRAPAKRTAKKASPRSR